MCHTRQIFVVCLVVVVLIAVVGSRTMFIKPSSSAAQTESREGTPSFNLDDEATTSTIELLEVTALSPPLRPNGISSAHPTRGPTSHASSLSSGAAAASSVVTEDIRSSRLQRRIALRKVPVRRENSQLSSGSALDGPNLNLSDSALETGHISL